MVGHDRGRRFGRRDAAGGAVDEVGGEQGVVIFLFLFVWGGMRGKWADERCLRLTYMDEVS